MAASTKSPSYFPLAYLCIEAFKSLRIKSSYLDSCQNDKWKPFEEVLSKMFFQLKYLKLLYTTQ